MGNIFAFVNQKGGVGKTASADNIAYCFAEMGKKTLLIDVDPSRSGTKPYCEDFEFSIRDVLADRNFDIKKAIYAAKIENTDAIENLFIIPSHVSLALLEGLMTTAAHREKILKNQLQKIKGDFDYIFLDLPPMLGVFSVNGIYAADKIIIPLKYEKDALDGIADLFRFIKEIKETQDFKYMILKNGFDGRKKTASAYVDEALKDMTINYNVFKTIIGQNEEINKAKLAECPVIVSAPNSLATAQYRQLAHEIKEVFS